MNAKFDSRSKSPDARHALMHSLAEQGGKVAEDVKALGRLAAKGARRSAKDFRTKGRRAFKSGIARARNAKHRFDHFVETHPIRALLIALGIGAVAGFLLRRKTGKTQS